MRFHDKVVLVVGAPGGLGAAVAEAFTAEGARLILAALNAVAPGLADALLTGRVFSSEEPGPLRQYHNPCAWFCCPGGAR